MPTALFVSPHLDDAVFSAGGLAGVLADRGWVTVLATVFTRSVVPAEGFALACQLDKGLAPDVDYMALRRAEDANAARPLGFTHTRWLDLLEAPHRGYHSAPALFGDVHAGDDVGPAVASALQALQAEFQPDLVLAPQGLGNHVDHQHVTAAAIACFPSGQIAFYRDTPYAIRQPDARPLDLVPASPAETVFIGPALDRKVAAAQAYATQIGFQFGGSQPLAAALRRFALQEGGDGPAERFTGCMLNSLINSGI